MTWEYIAGFFDGEGSITHNGSGFRITVSQTNQDVLNEIARFTDMGYIIMVTKRKSHWKDAWVYYIAKQQDVHRFLECCKTYLIVKKDLANKALPKIEAILRRTEAKKDLRTHRISQAKLLRAQGLTYRAIGKILKIDFGFARQLTLI